MAIAWIRKLFDEMGADTIGSGAPVRYFSRLFLAKSTIVNADVARILDDPLCPKRGAKDPFFNSAYIIDVQAETHIKDDPSVYWQIRVDSSTELPIDPDPTNEKAKISWEAVDVTRKDYRDVDGKPVFNSAQEIKWYEWDSANWVITVSKNLTQVPSYILSFENAINQSALVIDGIPFPKETLRCKGIRISEENDIFLNGVKKTFRNVSFRLEHDPLGWDIQVPDSGYYELIEKPVINMDPRNGFRTPLRDPETKKIIYRLEKVQVPILIDGRSPTEPVHLTSKGVALRDPPNENNIRYIKVKRRTKQNFNQLPLR